MQKEISVPTYLNRELYSRNLFDDLELFKKEKYLRLKVA